MKKVLLIGELNEVVRSLNECLAEEFQVQLCTIQLENVQGMVKITKPELVVYCEIGVEAVDNAILQWMQEKHAKIPVLIITAVENFRKYKTFLESSQFDKLFRPVMKSDLLDKCRRILNLGGAEWQNHTGFEPKKILIVDDSPLLLRNMKTILQDEYTVFLATSGEQALQMIPRKEPDLILLDYEMPGMDGKATFEAILADEFGKNIPVIFLTSKAEKEHVYAILKSNPDGYILKPASKAKLLDTIEEVLRKK